MSEKNEQLENNKKPGFTKIFQNRDRIPGNESAEELLDTEPINESLFDSFEADEKTKENEKPTQDDGLYVEKQNVGVNEPEKPQESSDGNGSTAVFTFAREMPAGTEISHEELSVSELEDSAKNYFNNTHGSNIEDKVNELCKLADNGFEDEAQDQEPAAETIADKFINYEEYFLENKPANNKKAAKKKKGHKNDILSDDDVITPEEDEQVEAEGDELDKNIRYAFGLEKGDNDDFGKKYEKLLADDEPDVEYTDRAQEQTILKSLRARASSSLVSVVLTLLLAVLCFYFESAAGTGMAHPSFFEPGRYGVVYAMSMLQLMFFGVMLNLDGVKRGFAGFRPRKASAESIAVAVGMICTIHAAGSALFAGKSASLHTYCTVGLLSLLLLAINTFVKSYTQLTSFCVAASKMPKFSTSELDSSSKEAQTFAKYLEQDTTIISVGKSDFAEGFFKKSFAVPTESKPSFSFTVVAVVGGIIAGALSAVFSGNVYTAFNTGCVVALAALPANMIISTALPFMLTSIKAKKTQTVFVGEAACDAYTSAGIISFDDTEVFPPKAVKVSSIRTYGENRIDKVIIYMARIFDKLGGPLSAVFANSVQDSGGNVGEAKVAELFDDGIRVKIDDCDIMLGTSGFMKMYDVQTPVDNIDESFIQSHGSIVYMTIGTELAAKFYIKYTINKNFESILRSLYDAGVCAGIRSCDPSVTNQLVCESLRGKNYPVSVIKKSIGDKSSAAIDDSTEGSVISLSGIHNLLRGFVKLDTLRNVYRSNSVIARVCSVVGLAAAALVTLTGAVSMPKIAFVVVFQLLWCLPTVVFSVLNK